jgi:uncharacterized protein with FMN-binding domain
MKKFVVAVIIVGSFILYSIMYGHSAATLPSSATNSSSLPASSSQPTTSGAGSTPGTLISQYKDGTYTGSVADAQWGYVQVQAIISNGKITDVKFLQYPHDRSRSIEINSYADPQLTSEAIQAQGANVDVITGATDSSEAFIQSLTDALSQAKI